MKSKLISPIYFNLKSSIWMMGIYLLISSVCIYGVSFLPIPVVVSGLVMLLVFFLFSYVIARDALLWLSHSWIAVEVSAHGVLTLTQRNQKRVVVKLKSSSVSHPYLTVLNFDRLDAILGRRSSLVVTPLQTRSLHGFRQLRVWLKYGQYPNIDHNLT